MKKLLNFSNSLVPFLHHYRFIILCGVIAILASSCQKSDIHVKKTVPLKAEFATVSTILQEGPPELDSIKGQGTGTPIGKSSFIAHAQFDAAFNLTGIIAATTENGDKFFASSQGHAPDIDEKGNISLHFEAVNTGGSGKFADATGNFSGIAHENMSIPNGTATWEGTITY